MNSFAQIITSFERTGNFPLEANYIFSTVEDLKEFYSDELEAATLHKGLLKLVENNGNDQQALYWVSANATTGELEFTELITGDNITDITSQLSSLAEELAAEIAARENADTALWGLSDPSNIAEGYNSINDLATQVQQLQEELSALDEETVSGDSSLLSQLKAIVGTTDNDMASYMETLPYNTITEIATELDRLINGSSDSEDTDTTDAIDTLAELSVFLTGYTSSDTLANLLEKLWYKIEGDTLPSTNFQTLRGVEDYFIENYTALTYAQSQILDEVNTMQSAIGLNADGSYTADSSTNYLTTATSVMGALRILDNVLYTYASANTPSVRNEDEAVYLSLTQELDSYVLSGTLKLSTESGNQLIKNTDGLFIYARTLYEDGILTFKVNDSIISQHYIGLSAIVDSAYYDSDNEQLVFVFKLDSGDTQTVYVPVSALIREWEPSNSDTSPIVLTRTQSTSGVDTLSADVNISTSSFNILVKDGNTLYVCGTTDNLYHSGTLLSDYLDSLAQTQTDFSTQISELQTSISENATAIANEVTQRTSDVASLTNDIEDLEASIKENSDAIAQEVTDRKDADTALELAITTETQRATAAENVLQLAIESEETRAEQVETAQATLIQTISEKLDSEVTRAVAVDQDLANQIENISLPEYTIAKQGTPETGYSATYNLTKDGVKTGDPINIPEQVTSASEIITDSSENVQSVLDELAEELAKKANTDSPILTGVPQVETSPDDNDSSQRIPSTAWVMARLTEFLETAKEYADSVAANPSWIEVSDSSGDDDTDTSDTVEASSWIDVGDSSD